ncbi:hypothetical protein SAMN05216196_101240 [Lutimaribacter pacificus]|uniref:Uncharacterized protein n=1 Tax=Lutimaribacter pacificus TaxID=391948 RepID=A0A1H0AQ83_9RHOB|nr:hypothetical protein [Lutimaribacter pacificus]SDN35136.1 hypothetical protein SAMN05216196_101240 [Lutimaribacter pacificus]SHJ66766.1 hypothetical protein SAMN05444142_101977 [Lutimaribacter pacificus]
MVAMPDRSETRLPRAQVQADCRFCSAISAAMRFGGAVLVLAAVGIWLVPVVTGDGIMVLMKLLVSVFFACVGMVLLDWGRAGAMDEIHLDTGSRQLTHIRRQYDGIPRVRARFGFDELSDIRLRDGMLTVIGNSGAVLVQLPVERVENLDKIRAGLESSLAKTA